MVVVCITKRLDNEQGHAVVVAEGAVSLPLLLFTALEPPTAEWDIKLFTEERENEGGGVGDDANEMGGGCSLVGVFPRP